MYLSSNRISVPYYRSSESHKWNRNDIQATLFKEDFSRNLLNRNKSKDSKITVSPDTKETRELLQALLFSRTSYRRNDFVDAMVQTLEYIATDIISSGFGLYEIVKKEIFPDHFVFELDRITGERIRFRRKKIEQFIPQIEAERLNTTIKHEIPIEKVLKIEFPKDLGGKKGLNKFLQDLLQFSEYDPTFNFLSSSLENEKNYNLEKHRRLHTVRYWKLTDKYGWDHRRSVASDEYFTEYFYLRRKLHFRRNQIILRNHIVSKLEEFINLQDFQFDNKPISVEFKLTPILADLNKAIDDWEKGEYDIEFIISLL